MSSYWRGKGHKREFHIMKRKGQGLNNCYQRRPNKGGWSSRMSNSQGKEEKSYISPHFNWTNNEKGIQWNEHHIWVLVQVTKM